MSTINNIIYESLSEHFKKHWKKYALGTALAGLGTGGAYIGYKKYKESQKKSQPIDQAKEKIKEIKKELESPSETNKDSPIQKAKEKVKEVHLTDAGDYNSRTENARKKWNHVHFLGNSIMGGYLGHKFRDHYTKFHSSNHFHPLASMIGTDIAASFSKSTDKNNNPKYSLVQKMLHHGIDKYTHHGDTAQNARKRLLLTHATNALYLLGKGFGTHKIANSNSFQAASRNFQSELANKIGISHI